MKTRLALVCSVAEEAAPLLGGLNRLRGKDLGPGQFFVASSDSLDVAVGVAGVGKVNAAQALTLLLERIPVWGVIGFGIGGVYPGSGLDAGDVAVAEGECFGDEGVATSGGFRGIESLGLPPESRLSPTYPADPGLRDGLLRAAMREGGKAVSGTFVTVSLCTGTHERGRWMRRRFGAVCESMEGAAFAQVAAAYGVPFGELRGISNAAGRRDRRTWKIRAAAEAAGRVLLRFLHDVSRGGTAWTA